MSKNIRRLIINRKNKSECVFCTIDRSRLVYENEHFYSVLDSYPVSPGHILVIPKKHSVNFKDLDSRYGIYMVNAIQCSLDKLSPAKLKSFYQNNIQNPLDDNSKRLCKSALDLMNDFKVDDFNLGINNGKIAGQTIFHLHIHLIPRIPGDGGVGRGGVRHIIPGKGDYKIVPKKMIIGVSGTNAAGKDTFSNYLINHIGGQQVRLGYVLRDRLQPNKLPTRENLSKLGAQIRQDYGMAALVNFAVDNFEKGAESHLIINGVRHPDEARRIKELGGLVFWIEAPLKLRYKRIQDNNRGRDEDRVDFAEFKRQQQLDMSSKTKSGNDLNKVKKIVDITINNNFETIPEFEKEINRVFPFLDY